MPNAWSQLRKLLLYLDRLRLRRTLATLRGLYGGSVWKLSGLIGAVFLVLLLLWAFFSGWPRPECVATP
ncbi:MAG TPA: hypothetical protein VF772_07090, partial [Terriglobales bacterium]